MTIDVASMIEQSLIGMITPFIISAATVFIIGIIFLTYRYYRRSKSGILAIDKMSGTDFEARLAILFKKLGYSVKQVGNQKGDYGVDLILEKDGVKTAVQAKCYKPSLVGESAVREAYTGKGYYQCSDAWVVTNSHYSRMAINLARANNVQLISRNQLVRLLLQEKSTTLLDSQ